MITVYNNVFCWNNIRNIWALAVVAARVYFDAAQTWGRMFAENRWGRNA